MLAKVTAMLTVSVDCHCSYKEKRAKKTRFIDRGTGLLTSECGTDQSIHWSRSNASSRPLIPDASINTMTHHLLQLEKMTQSLHHSDAEETS